MVPIYVISGLGADERVFQQVNFAGNPVTFIKWEHPEGTSMSSYATKLLKLIREPKPILIGLSFGGMMAIEIAKQIDVQQLILIASVKTRSELPFYYKFAGYLKLHKLLPVSVLKSSNHLSNWFFGASNAHEKEILKLVLKDTDPVFLKWAINEIVRWKNEGYPTNIIHIHGSNDRILPIRNIKYDYKIDGAGHLMTLNKAREIDAIMAEVLQHEK